MRAVALLLVPLVAAVTTLAGAQNPATDPKPVITGSDPAVLLVTSENRYVTVTLRGKNFWPSGPNEPSRWRIQMRRDGGAFQEFRTSSGNDFAETFSFPSTEWIAKPGKLEVKVVRDGVHSNVYAIEVRTTPPTLTQLSPRRIALGDVGDKARYTVVMRGAYWTSPTTPLINGKAYAPFHQNLNSGQESFVWPTELRKPGRFTVQLQTEHGKSQFQEVEIVGAPTSVAPAARVSTGDIASAGATLKARVRFSGSAPDEVQWRTDRHPLRALTFVTNIRGDEAIVDVPTADLKNVPWFEIKLKNIAGEGVARFVIDRSIIAEAGGRPVVPGGANTRAAAPSGVVQPPPVAVPAGPPSSRPVTRPGTRPATPAVGAPAVTAPGASRAASPVSPVTAPAATPGATSAAPAAAPAQTTVRPASAPVVAPAAVQGARPSVGAPAGIIVQGGRTTIDSYRANLQRSVGANASRVTSTMQGTTLVLTGTVPTEAARQAAASAATGVAGISAVRNELRVAP